MSAYNDAQSLRAAIDRDVEIDELREYASALVASVEDLFEGTLAERLGKLMTDENGLPLTRPALHVMVSVLTAIDAEDERWGEKSLPGIPSVTDYAATVLRHVRRRYSTPGVQL